MFHSDNFYSRGDLNNTPEAIKKLACKTTEFSAQELIVLMELNSRQAIEQVQSQA